MQAKEKIDPFLLGWDAATLGEIDHRQVKPPYVRMTSFKRGIRGDVVYLFDLRITRPNKTYMTTLEMHSMEHLLLAGFRKYLPATFVNIAPMGCQTGFYLVTINEGKADEICDAYFNCLNDIIKATSVPYANIHDCGQYIHHDLQAAQKIAATVLEGKNDWLRVFRED